MAQQVARFRVLLPSSVAAEDSSSNDFYFEATGSNVSLLPSDVFTAIEFFYNGLATGQAQPVGGYLSGDIDRGVNACSITMTDITNVLNGDPAGSPIASTTFSLSNPLGGSNLPENCAVAIAYRSQYGTDIEHGPITSLPSDDDAIDQGAPPTHLGRTRPRARDRGRFYLGPLNSRASQSLTTGSGPGANVNPTFVADLTAALHNFLEAKQPGQADQFQAVVWSRRGAKVANAAFFYVNEFLASRRNRADTTAARVHNWVAV